MANNITKQEEYLKTLEINVLSKEQYEQEKDDGKLHQNAFYLTPDTSVSYTSQILTTQQQAQARDNIGAADAVSVGNIETALDSILAIQNQLIGGDGA